MIESLLIFAVQLPFSDRFFIIHLFNKLGEFDFSLWLCIN